MGAIAAATEGSATRVSRTRRDGTAAVQMASGAQRVVQMCILVIRVCCSAGMESRHVAASAKSAAVLELRVPQTVTAWVVLPVSPNCMGTPSRKSSVLGRPRRLQQLHRH
jgi:hypothetical protein